MSWWKGECHIVTSCIVIVQPSHFAKFQCSDSADTEQHVLLICVLYQQPASFTIKENLQRCNDLQTLIAQPEVLYSDLFPAYRILTPLTCFCLLLPEPLVKPSRRWRGYHVFIAQK